MESFLNKIKENKKVVIIASVALLLVIAGTITLFAVSNAKKTKTDQKADLTEILKSLGTDFYEDFYYLNIGSSDEERATKLERYNSIGIKVDLDNLSRYNSEKVKDKIAKFKNEETGEDCDKTNTKVIIYPKSPYGKKDYEIETKIVCGFEE